MTKKQEKGQKDDKNTNKVHKTLRQKLRKKRQDIKKHKKQKSEQKKQYNPELQKEKYFSQGETKQENVKELKMKKVNKYIERFINIYEDDLNDFYGMFKTFDDKGFVNISELQNKSLYKALKKLFKYLPLKKEKKQYSKVESSKLNLQRFMKQKVSEAIQNYLQNGSNEQVDNEQSSEDDENKQQTKKHSKKQKKVKEEAQQKPEEVKLYKNVAQEYTSSVGPYIPPEIRQQMALLFDKELQQRKKEKERLDEQQQNQFTRIFSLGRTKKQIKESKFIKPTQPFPQHLMAKGSAVLGQKMVIDDNEIQEYNKIHRPKKLIEMHKELRQNMIGEDTTTNKKGFNRQGSLSAKLSLMQNSTFFDFKSRMSKPQTTNQFL